VSHELVSRATCGGCVFYRPLNEGLLRLNVYACHYCSDMGELRGCPISKCTRKRAPNKARDDKLRVSKFNPNVNHKRQKATKDSV
jgi:hypothetical protein